MDIVQKTLFLEAEGDAWFSRNKQALHMRAVQDDPVLGVIDRLQLGARNVLEVGCADGWRLRELEARTGAACHGIDPSAEAIAQGLKQAPHQGLKIGTAEKLELPDKAVDLLIYGFCLYLCDRGDLFRIAAEGDRVLQEGGHIVVYDFCTDTAYRNAYSHKPGVYCYKMQYADLFSWNPAYSVVHHQLVPHGGVASDVMDERVGITVLRKHSAEAYPDNPYI